MNKHISEFCVDEQLLNKKPTLANHQVKDSRSRLRCRNKQRYNHITKRYIPNATLTNHVY